MGGQLSGCFCQEIPVQQKEQCCTTTQYILITHLLYMLQHISVRLLQHLYYNNKVNNRNSGTIIKQLLGCVQGMKWSTVYCVVVKTFKHITVKFP